MKRNWNETDFHGTRNEYPFTEVVSCIKSSFPNLENRDKIRILDLGCGGGSHLLFLAQEGFDYFGIDGNEKALNRAQALLSKFNFSINNVTLGEITNMVYPDNFFDFVIDRGTITCNTIDDQNTIFDQIFRTLKLGGRLFTSHLDIISSSTNSGEETSVKGDFVNFKGRLQDSVLLHYTSPIELMSNLQENNFEVVELSRTTKLIEYPLSKAPIQSSWITALAIKNVKS